MPTSWTHAPLPGIQSSWARGLADFPEAEWAMQRVWSKWPQPGCDRPQMAVGWGWVGVMRGREDIGGLVLRNHLCPRLEATS